MNEKTWEWHLQAENFGEFIEEEYFLRDNFWEKAAKKAVGKSSTLFLGKRGSGKTMLFKYSYTKLLNEYKEEKTLPVYISLSAFLANHSLPRIGEFTDTTKEFANDLFFIFLHNLILKRTIYSINHLKLKPQKDIEILDMKIKKNSIKNLDESIERLKEDINRKIVPKIIFRTNDFDYSLSFNFEVNKTARSVIVEKVDVATLITERKIIESLNNIINCFGINHLIFYFDELPGLGYLTSDFFDFLYLFRDQSKISFKIGSYPHYTNLGSTFDIPDDAESFSLDRALFKPNINLYYEYFMDLLVLATKQNKSTLLNSRISEEAFKFLAIGAGGNPRLFLTFFRDVSEINGTKNSQIKVKDISNSIESIYHKIYLTFLKENARRHLVNEDNCLALIEAINSRLGARNKSKETNTTFVGISQTVTRKYEAELKLLDYSRIFEFYDSKVLSGSLGMGKRYTMNLFCAAFFKTFKYKTRGIRTQFHVSLIDHLEDMQSKDLKIVISKDFGEEVELDDILPSKTVSEPMEESIEVLNFSKFVTRTLIKEGYGSVEKINRASDNDLLSIRNIGKKRLQAIRNRIQEYISDNFI